MKTLISAGAGIIVIAMASVGCDRAKSAETGELIAAYSRAACLAPAARDPSERSPTRAWTETFDLGSGVSVRIDATCAVAGAVMGKYSDEPTPRTIAGLGDAMSPCDLRIDWMQMRLYVRAEGPIGAFQRMELHEYDLQARQSPRKAGVDPALVSPRCEGGAGKPQ